LAISAYITLMDDWDILHAALSSIAPVVDEIVVADGAYAWMEPYFTACGRDPAHSNPHVARVLDQFGAKLRVIRGVWQDEIHKRVAGFEACRHRFVLRADADEVALLDPARIDAFLRSDAAVATADVPMMVTPDWVRARADGQPERLGVLFDRQRITAAQHLAHLWLIMPPEEQDRVSRSEGAVFAESLGFIAHLTHWRRPETAVSRARFYVLNHYRGAATLPLLGDSDPGAGFTPLFQQISPADWDALMLSHAIVSGLPDMTGFELRPMPIEVTPALPGLYANFLTGLAALNDRVAIQSRPVLHGEPLSIDLTSPLSCQDGSLTLGFSKPLIDVKASISVITAEAPWSATIPVSLAITHNTATLQIPNAPAACLRRSLTLSAWCQTYDKVIRMQAIR
jgi:hypothetical protein